jgi:hypothetical protein
MIGDYIHGLTHDFDRGLEHSALDRIVVHGDALLTSLDTVVIFIADQNRKTLQEFRYAQLQCFYRKTHHCGYRSDILLVIHLERISSEKKVKVIHVPCICISVKRYPWHVTPIYRRCIGCDEDRNLENPAS